MAIEFDTLSALTLGATTRDVRYLVDESGFYGQTFVATSSRLTTVEFAIDASTVGIATTFSVMVATVRYDSLGFHPNAVIYESPLIREVADTDSVWSLISVNTNGIVLNPGEMYVILFNANAGNDDEMGSIRFAVKPTNDAGFFVYRNNPVTDQDTATIFNRAWSAEPANGATRSWGDIAMRLTYGAANTAPGLPADADGSGDTGGANATIAEDLAVGSAIGLTAASVDVDGDTVTYSFGLDGNGQSKLNEGPFAIDAASGVVTLAAQLDYETTGSYTLTVVASDGTVSSHSNFQVNVTNVAPTAAQDSGSATEAGTQAGAAASGNVLGNDVEVGNPANKSVSAVAHGAATGVVGASLAGDYGTLTLNADGSYGYVVNDENPAVNALGAYADTLIDSFTYTVRDSAGGSSSTTLAITVHGANDAPVARGDSGSVGENMSRVFDWSELFANDLDPDTGDVLKITSVQAGDGTVTFDAAARTVTYTANADRFDALAAGATTQDSFTYTVTDRAGVTSTAIVDMTITGQADGRIIFGGNHGDKITTGSNVRRDTSSGDDTVYGGNGSDRVWGGDGADRLLGENGDDRLYGGNGSDHLEGGRGDDRLYGGNGNDRLDGGRGDDLLWGDRGNDILTGGQGEDRFVFAGGFLGSDRDVITDFQRNDRIQLLDGLKVTSATAVNLEGGAAMDTLLGLSNGTSIVLTDFGLDMWRAGGSGLIA